MLKINKKYINLDLRGKLITGATYRDSEFVDLCLDKSRHEGVEALIFENCRIEDINFRQGFVKNVIFRECFLNGVDLTQTKLENVSFPQSILLNCKFDLSILKNVDFSTAQRIDNSTFDGATKSMVKQLKLEKQKENKKVTRYKDKNFTILDIINTMGTLMSFLVKFHKKL